MAARIVIVAGLVALFDGVSATTFYSGATLPLSWKNAATTIGVDWSKLGFNTTESQWYYDGVPTCIGFGSRDDFCDSSTRLCSSPLGGLYGGSLYQMREVKNMLDEGLTQHKLCPVCPAPPAGFIYVCHNGKQTVALDNPGGQDSSSPLGSPGQKSVDPTSATWFTCDCEEVHRGFHLDAAYWQAKATEAGLQPEKVTYFAGAWYYDAKFSCVAYGFAAQPCDHTQLVCAGAGNTCGYGGQQMAELHQASILPTGEHSHCPPQLP